MDDTSYLALLNLDLPHVRAIALEVFERDDEMLLGAKQNRSRIEYYFTCTPSLPLYVMNHWPEVDLITYLDADLFFFGTPSPLFDEIGDGSIAITPHDFPPALEDRERYGLYNVGWVSFRRDPTGRACLGIWRTQCIDWCFDREDHGRFADQKYLDEWPTRFDNVVVLKHRGANVALWNLENRQLRSSAGGRMTLDGDPLIFFHFHALKRVARWVYDPGFAEYRVTPSRLLKTRVYLPYLRSLFRTNRELLASFRSDPMPGSPRVPPPSRPRQQDLPRLWLHRLREFTSLTKAVATGTMIFFLGE